MTAAMDPAWPDTPPGQRAESPRILLWHGGMENCTPFSKEFNFLRTPMLLARNFGVIMVKAQLKTTSGFVVRHCYNGYKKHLVLYGMSFGFQEIQALSRHCLDSLAVRTVLALGTNPDVFHV